MNIKYIDKEKQEVTGIILHLTEQQKEIFEKFKDCQSEFSGIGEQEAFTTVFILATRIIVEVMEGLQTAENRMIFNTHLM